MLSFLRPSSPARTLRDVHTFLSMPFFSQNNSGLFRSTYIILRSNILCSRSVFLSLPLFFFFFLSSEGMNPRELCMGQPTFLVAFLLLFLLPFFGGHESQQDMYGSAYFSCHFLSTDFIINISSSSRSAISEIHVTFIKCRMQGVARAHAPPPRKKI